MTGSRAASTIDIPANLDRVRARIDNAAHAAGRDPASVRLIAVSKTHGTEAVQAAISAGQHDFGENRIQEALPKIRQLVDEDAVWHFIGRLQSNKAKFIPENFQWLHTLDQVSLARSLATQIAKKGVELQCLIQVNVVADPAKGGVTPQSLAGLLTQLQESGLPGIRLRGLMTIGPHGGSEKDLRQCFASLRKLLEDNQSRFALKDFDQLSMGMTTDLEAAVREGATMVRVGSAIFGER